MDSGKKLINGRGVVWFCRVPIEDKGEIDPVIGYGTENQK
jgi:hypothetical protein